MINFVLFRKLTIVIVFSHVHVWGPEDNFQDLAVSFHLVSRRTIVGMSSLCTLGVTEIEFRLLG